MAAVLRVASEAASMPGFDDAWGSSISVSDLHLRIWTSWQSRSRLALILREQPELRPADLTLELLDVLDAPASALLVEARVAVPEQTAALQLSDAEMEADIQSLQSADALDKALIALGVTKKEEGAEQWDKVAQALHETATLLKAVETLGSVREKLSQDAAALAQQVAHAESEGK